ncbi:hypothetical protein [Fluviicola sp.]|jgi:hypothetical protein|uniref:hypothetical protein n=1 Tax=Fluviicola sp. TaxID=1917219 RepID=UPI002820C3E3|nr:hypothetical protein [Fluviicola sp.]MDR0802288.1 hypothetical protein [Fluviicola sp.]
MREELKSLPAENVKMVVVPETNEEGEIQHYVYLLNLRDDIMEGIIVTSKGYGEDVNTGEKIKTSTLRHSLEVLLPNEAAKIEPIMEEVFGLTNEYWVSFWIEDVLYDKKFIFLPETISEKNFIGIPKLGGKGIMVG